MLIAKNTLTLRFSNLNNLKWRSRVYGVRGCVVRLTNFVTLVNLK